MASELIERVRIKQRVDRELDLLYERAKALGEEMGILFKAYSRSQLRNLETVAAAATRTSILKNHVKNQTGKDRLRYEQHQTWARGAPSLGERTLTLLDELGGRAAVIVAPLPIKDEEDRHDLARSVEIELQRGVVQTAVCAALYANPEASR